MFLNSLTLRIGPTTNDQNVIQNGCQTKYCITLILKDYLHTLTQQTRRKNTQQTGILHYFGKAEKVPRVAQCTTRDHRQGSKEQCIMLRVTSKVQSSIQIFFYKKIIVRLQAEALYSQGVLPTYIIVFSKTTNKKIFPITD